MTETFGKSNSKSGTKFRWLRTGREALAEMLRAVRNARHSVKLEMYLFEAGPVAEQFRDALTAACRRGAKVRVLLDALGSSRLPEEFWNDFKAAGGDFRWFNPVRLHRPSVRDHRKLLICDDAISFVGGCNIAEEYNGDGVENGWRDLALRINGPFSRQLAAAFDAMFRLADFRHKRFARLRKTTDQSIVWTPDASLLLGTPGRSRPSPLNHALYTDVARAKKIQIISAYFLPTGRLRRLLAQAARRGCKVQIILPAKSDVGSMLAASRSLYRRLLAAGVDIYEYQPQVLHAKLILIDESTVYAGSANLDIRSLQINYELLVRSGNRALAAEAADIFQDVLRHTVHIKPRAWAGARSWWERLKSRLAYFVFARLDPYVVEWQLRRLHLAHDRSEKTGRPANHAK